MVCLHFANIGAFLTRNISPFYCQYFQHKAKISEYWRIVDNISYIKLKFNQYCYFIGSTSHEFNIDAIFDRNITNIGYLQEFFQEKLF